MQAILIDLHWKRLLPLTFTRPLSDLLIGMNSIAQKWTLLGIENSSFSCAYLNKPRQLAPSGLSVLVNSAVIPTPALAEALKKLAEGDVLTHRGRLVAAHARLDGHGLAAKIQSGEDLSYGQFGTQEIFFNDDLTFIESPADIFAQNDAILRDDFGQITKNYHTAAFPKNVIVSGDEIYIHPQAKLNHCVLNAETGPIYIDKGAEVMEGALVRGPFYLGESSSLKMGAKIYGATSIGKRCKVGGEVNNAVINDYSNKGHDGFLGNSVIGSWCNLGADTNTSNLKNNYGNVKVWNYATEQIEATERQFQGLIMGDHSKASINTMFNTGTVVGLCANIFDGGFPPKFIPSFSWGSAAGFETFRIEKAIEAAKAMMARRSVPFTPEDRELFQAVFELEARHR